MKGNLLETVLGGVVLSVAVFFLYFAYSSADRVKVSDGYEIVAKFDRIDGLSRGADVRMSGVKVGTITNMELDTDTFLAIVSMNVSHNLKLPDDSSAEVVSDGLMGGKYIALVPGGSDEILTHGGQVKFTQASVNLESLIGQLIFSSKDKDTGKEK